MHLANDRDVVSRNFQTLLQHEKTFEALTLQAMAPLLTTAGCDKEMHRSRLDGQGSALLAVLRRRGGAVSGVGFVSGEAGDLAGDLDVVVRELAQLRIIQTKLLLLGRDTEAQAGDEVHEEEDEGGQAERPEETGGGAGQLVAELDPVVLDPATGDLAAAVKGGNIRARERVSDGNQTGQA